MCEIASIEPAGIQVDGQCCYTVTRACPSPVGCGCSHGRPLLIAGVARVAVASNRDGWFDTRLRAPDCAGLDRLGRARLAHVWASIGVNEHASIASFHRAAIELCALGAPAELIAAATRAAGDEVRHARAAFTLASHFVGARLGPAPLPLPAPPRGFPGGAGGAHSARRLRGGDHFGGRRRGDGGRRATIVRRASGQCRTIVSFTASKNIIQPA